MPITSLIFMETQAYCTSKWSCCFLTWYSTMAKNKHLIFAKNVTLLPFTKQQLCIKPIGFLVVFSTKLNLWLVLLFKLYFNKSNSKMPSLWQKPTFSALYYTNSEWYEARIVSKDLQERFFTPERNKFVYSFIKLCIVQEKKASLQSKFSE